MDNSIDLISNIALNNINSVKSNNSADNAAKKDSDTMIRSDFAMLLDKAITAPDVDHQAVAASAAQITAGTLDTPQNIQQAAQNMLAYGI